MSVIKQAINIEHIPAIIWGIPSSKVFLYIHGQGGEKEEADMVANIICPRGFQILSVDLPEHGERKGGKMTFLIEKMMGWANVTEEQLQKEKNNHNLIWADAIMGLLEICGGTPDYRLAYSY